MSSASSTGNNGSTTAHLYHNQLHHHQINHSGPGGKLGGRTSECFYIYICLCHIWFTVFVYRNHTSWSTWPCITLWYSFVPQSWCCDSVCFSQCSQCRYWCCRPSQHWRASKSFWCAEQALRLLKQPEPQTRSFWEDEGHATWNEVTCQVLLYWGFALILNFVTHRNTCFCRSLLCFVTSDIEMNSRWLWKEVLVAPSKQTWLFEFSSPCWFLTNYHCYHCWVDWEDASR